MNCRTVVGWRWAALLAQFWPGPGRGGGHCGRDKQKAGCREERVGIPDKICKDNIIKNAALKGQSHEIGFGGVN